MKLYHYTWEETISQSICPGYYADPSNKKRKKWTDKPMIATIKAVEYGNSGEAKLL